MTTSYYDTIDFNEKTCYNKYRGDIIMRTHDFVNSIKVGEFGEQVIKRYLLQKDNILHITDVSKIPDFQKQDIDLVVDFRNGKRATIEV